MKKILEVQKKIGSLSKNSKNPFFKSQYLNLNDLLNEVKPLLEAEGLILIQPIKGNEVFSIIIDAESGDEIEDSYMKIPENITDPQKLGSCVTYFRRYTLKSLLAIAEEDDDGNKASKKKVIILTDENINSSIKKGTQKETLKGIKENKYSATPEQITKLK